MKLFIKNTSQKLLILIVIIFNSSCSTDRDDFNPYNIEGNWKQKGIYTYDLEQNLIESKHYNVVWNVQKDSIEYTNTFYMGEDFGNGVVNDKFSYKTFPDGGFYHSQQTFKIDVLTEDDLIFSIRRPDLIHKFHYYSID